MKLFTYHRNSAGERIRIALNLKDIDYTYVSVPTLGGDGFRAINPQRLMPAVEINGRVVAQSTAILEYLEESYPEPPLLPAEPVTRAEARSFGQLIACDLHPINVNRVRRYLVDELKVSEPDTQRWYEHWVTEAFTALEEILRRRRTDWPFCFGETPGWADLHLVPQVRNARRFDCDLAPYPLLTTIDARCVELDAFKRAHPTQQPDYPNAKPA